MELPQEVFLEILNFCDLLTILTFSRCSKYFYQLAHFPKLIARKHIKLSSDKITNVVIHSLTSTCPLLKTLEISGCGSITDQSLIYVAKYCKNLESLTLKHNEKISENGMNPIAENCTALKELNLVAINISTDTIKKLTNLQNLSVLKIYAIDKDNVGPYRRITEREFLRYLNLKSVFCNPKKPLVFKQLKLLIIEFWNGGYGHVMNNNPFLRINNFDEKELPEHVDVYCDICKIVLWKSISRYVVGPPSQPQLMCELYTNEEPIWDNTCIHQSGNTLKRNCKKNCHKNLWLIDCGSGDINLRSMKYAIAVGEGKGQFCKAGCVPSGNTESNNVYSTTKT